MTRQQSPTNPSWQIQYEEQFAEWEAARNAPPPRPEPPNLEPTIETMVPTRDGASLADMPSRLILPVFDYRRDDNTVEEFEE